MPWATCIICRIMVKITGYLLTIVRVLAVRMCSRLAFVRRDRLSAGVFSIANLVARFSGLSPIKLRGLVQSRAHCCSAAFAF